MGQMRMSKMNFYQTLNEQLIETFSSSPKLNYCRFLLPEKEGQVSLVARYVPCFSPESSRETVSEPYITLAVSDKSQEGLEVVESCDYDAYYYGISPAINETVIVESMADKKFTSLAGLDAFIAEHCTGFMLHNNQRDYLIPCARLFVLSIAHNFGIKLKVEADLRERLLRFAGTTMVEEGPQTGDILLCGSPTEELFQELDGYYFKKDAAQSHWKCCNTDGEGLSIRDIFARRENIILLKGHTFYSGALLRILYVDKNIQSYGNDTVAPLQFLFERSSYGTVYTFDNNYTNHPLLNTCRDKLIEMYRKDDACKLKLLKNTKTTGTRVDYLNAVNEYLKVSTNVNQIGVTGNIITTDGVLLIGERESASIDAGEIYPSVNGNAEVIDGNVGFYKLYANEDYPTIDLKAPRIDFYGELNREARAELSLATRSDAWHCYGFTISGNIPEEESGGAYSSFKRRMHFNILCEQVCNDSFEHIVENQKTATEAFENRTLKGLMLDYYPNRRSMVCERFLNGCRVILDNESYIMAVAAICVFISTIITAFQNESLTSMAFTLSDMLSIGFSVLGVIMILFLGCKAVKKYIFRKKHITKIHIIGSLSGKRRDGLKQIAKYFKMHSCHPVAFAAVMAYVLRISKYE